MYHAFLYITRFFLTLRNASSLTNGLSDRNQTKHAPRAGQRRSLPEWNCCDAGKFRERQTAARLEGNEADLNYIFNA